MLISPSNLSKLLKNRQIHFLAYLRGHFSWLSKVKVEVIQDFYTLVIVLIN